MKRTGISIGWWWWRWWKLEHAPHHLINPITTIEHHQDIPWNKQRLIAFWFYDKNIIFSIPVYHAAHRLGHPFWYGSYCLYLYAAAQLHFRFLCGYEWHIRNRRKHITIISLKQEIMKGFFSRYTPNAYHTYIICRQNVVTDLAHAWKYNRNILMNMKWRQCQCSLYSNDIMTRYFWNFKILSHINATTKLCSTHFIHSILFDSFN